MATPEHADTLQEMIEEGRDGWPLKQEQGIQRQLSEWAALRDSDRAMLAAYHPNWNQRYPGERYVVDPLAERIAQVFPDLIFGADPEITAAAPPTKKDEAGDTVGDSPDQELLDGAIEENQLPSELQEAAAVCVAEGEVWWRIYVDSDAFEFPVIEWHSRRNVVPLWRGRKAVAVAFVADLDNLAPDAPVVRLGDDADPAGQLAWRASVTSADDAAPVFRYVTIHTDGMTRNLLYRGERAKLGERVALSAHPSTQDLNDEWRHDLTGMLAGRVANGRGGRLGRSQYAGIKDLLYALNEAAAIGEHNARLTLRRRAVMSADMVDVSGRGVAAAQDEEGNVRRRPSTRMDDVFLTHPDDEMDTAGGAPMKVLEYSFDAQALSVYTEGLTDRALTRARVAPQLVGRATEGAATGPALRARLLDSILAANGMARAWDDELPKILLAEMRVMALPEEQGGHGLKLKDSEHAPSVERSSTLPEDEDAFVVRLTTEVGAEILSKRSAIEERHPDWDPERVQKELDRIEEDKASLPGEPGAVPPEAGEAPAPGAPTDVTGAVTGEDLTQLREGDVQVFRSGDELRVRGLPAPGPQPISSNGRG